MAVSKPPNSVTICWKQKREQATQNKVTHWRPGRLTGNVQLQWSDADASSFLVTVVLCCLNSSKAQTRTLLSWSRALSICSSWAIFCLVADAWLFPFGSCDSSGRRWPTQISRGEWTTRNHLNIINILRSGSWIWRSKKNTNLVESTSLAFQSLVIEVKVVLQVFQHFHLLFHVLKNKHVKQTIQYIVRKTLKLVRLIYLYVKSFYTKTSLKNPSWQWHHKTLVYKHHHWGQNTH